MILKFTVLFKYHGAPERLERRDQLRGMNRAIVAIFLIRPSASSRLGIL